MERTIEPQAPGPNRIEVDAPLLEDAQPLRYSGNRFISGLGDLRIRDRNGAEIPYILVAPRSAPTWLRASVLPIRATKKTSGFEADLGAPHSVDAIRLPDLRAPFLKRFRLEGSGDRQRWTQLVSEGTLFDLPAESMVLREAEFEPGEYRYLRLTWDDRTSGVMPLPDRVEVRRASIGNQTHSLLPAEVTRRTSEPGASRFHIRLPGSNLPLRAIRIRTREETLSRRASVFESRLIGAEATPVSIGSATLRKIQQDEGTAEGTRIPVEPPIGPDLELVVDDGDNPPLDLEAVELELPPLPWIYFEAPSAEPLIAVWGRRSLEAPEYDLAARRENLDLDRVPVASWGPAMESDAGDASPPRPVTFDGAPVERSQFRWMKPVPPSEPGLTSLLIDEDVQAHSRDLADVRIVGDDDRQIPYLVERRDEPMEIPLRLGPRTDEGEGWSGYTLELPWPTTPPGTKLVVRTGERVFDRNVRIVTAGDGSRLDGRTLDETRWAGTVPEREAPPLVLQPYLHGSDVVRLLIDEGDNAPLELSGVSLLIPSVRFRFIRGVEHDDLELLYGAPSLRKPRYDIGLIAPRLFGEPANEIAPGEEVALREDASEASALRWFWIVIVVATVALLLVIARLLKPGHL